MMPLNRENIAKYLADQNICLPKETSKLWKIIDTPFMLELYAAVENKKSEDSAEPHKVQNSETAGGIIKAYLKKEIERYHKNNKVKRVICAVHDIRLCNSTICSISNAERKCFCDFI